MRRWAGTGAIITVAACFAAGACDKESRRTEDDDSSGGSAGSGGSGGSAGLGGTGGDGGSAGQTPSVCGDTVCSADEDCEPVNWVFQENPCEADCGRCEGWCVPTEQGALTACNPFTNENYQGDPCPGHCQWIYDEMQFYCTANDPPTEGLGAPCDQGVGGPYCMNGLACPDIESNVDDGEVCEEICCSDEDCSSGTCGASPILAYVGVCQ